ncbi:MAG: acetyl-CoA carboxylase carboxyltransferase subunit beta [Lactobacillus sp.]
MPLSKFTAPTSKEISFRMDKIPDHIWRQCPICHQSFYEKKLGQAGVCPECGYGFRLGAQKRVEQVADQFKPIDVDLKAPAQFQDAKYLAKLAKARQVTELNESVLTGIARTGKQRFGLGVMDSRFIMGSLGSATGEKITRLFEKCTQEKLPVILFTASGGARMQEGIHSLMQMAKISQAVAEHSVAGLLYVAVLTDPTTGGVTASYAMQADIILSEPRTLIGFAGRRVIEQTIHQKPPVDFQRAETLLKHGFLDAIVPRAELKTTLAKLLRWHQKGGQAE